MGQTGMRLQRRIWPEPRAVARVVLGPGSPHTETVARKIRADRISLDEELSRDTVGRLVAHFPLEAVPLRKEDTQALQLAAFRVQQHVTAGRRAIDQMIAACRPIGTVLPQAVARAAPSVMGRLGEFFRDPTAPYWVFASQALQAIDTIVNESQREALRELWVETRRELQQGPNPNRPTLDGLWAYGHRTDLLADLGTTDVAADVRYAARGEIQAAARALAGLQLLLGDAHPLERQLAEVTRMLRMAVVVRRLFGAEIALEEWIPDPAVRVRVAGSRPSYYALAHANRTLHPVVPLLEQEPSARINWSGLLVGDPSRALDLRGWGRKRRYNPLDGIALASAVVRADFSGSTLAPRKANGTSGSTGAQPPDLRHALLFWARFRGARLAAVRLEGAELAGLDLSAAKFLSGNGCAGNDPLHLAGAIYSTTTLFPPTFDPQQAGMRLLTPSPPRW
ncbi:MAG: hypothetical protein HY696_12395 [Deltaproteobacteria bacterium]|nr:hypothetical protein [Deltaproteobacteria bacterium]